VKLLKSNLGLTINQPYDIIIIEREVLVLTREQEIENNMKLLQISREEAEQLYDDDHSDEVLPEVAEMEKKAKSMKRRYETDKIAERKKSTRTPKIDAEKVEIINTIAKMLAADELKITNIQREITFKIGENDYSLVLTKHRKSKKGA
jgi:hypothetical protein